MLDPPTMMDYKFALQDIKTIDDINGVVQDYHQKEQEAQENARVASKKAEQKPDLDKLKKDIKEEHRPYTFTAITSIGFPSLAIGMTIGGIIGIITVMTAVTILSLLLLRQMKEWNSRLKPYETVVKYNFPFSIRFLEIAEKEKDNASPVSITIADERKVQIFSQLVKQDIAERKTFFTSTDNPLHQYRKNIRKTDTKVATLLSLAKKLPRGTDKDQLVQRARRMNKEITSVNDMLATEHKQTQNMLAAIDALANKVIGNYQDYLDMQKLNKELDSVVEIDNLAGVERELAKLYTDEFTPCVNRIVGYQQTVQESISMDTLSPEQVETLLKKQRDLGFSK